MAQATNICAEDLFTLTVPLQEPCAVDVDDEYTTSPIPPGTTLHTVGFLYQGGRGDDESDTFNGYCYDRSDELPDGTARTAGTRETPLTNSGLPSVSNFDPPVPNSGRPSISESERRLFRSAGTQPNTNRKRFIENLDSPDGLWWIGSCDIGPFPDAEAATGAAERIHENTLFYFALELAQDD